MQASTEDDLALGSETDHLLQVDESHEPTSSTVLRNALDGVALHGDEGDCTQILDCTLLTQHKHCPSLSLSEASRGIVRQRSSSKATAR